MTVTSLPEPRRRHQRFHQVRIHAGAVDRLLDRHHVRVARGHADEVDHGLERLERVVQQDVVLAHLLEDVEVGGLGRHAGDERRRSAAPAACTWSISSARRTRLTGPSTAYSRLGSSSNWSSRNCDSSGGQFFATSSRTEVPNWRPCNSPLQRLAQVLDLVLVDPQVAVAGDPELRIGDHVAPGEHVFDVRVDHRRQQAEQGAAALGQFVGQLDHARQHARRLDDGDRGAAPERVLAGQRDDEIEALVDHLRERMGRVEPDRRQQRAHLALEILLDPGALRFVAVGVAHQVHAFARAVAAALRY